MLYNNKSSLKSEESEINIFLKQNIFSPATLKVKHRILKQYDSKSSIRIKDQMVLYV